MAQVTTSDVITLIRGLIKDLAQTDGRDSHTYDSDTSFSLSKDYVVESSISVYKNGTELTLTTDYTYNSTTNKITITASLTKNDDILITYNYYARYSDSEITSFIKSSLSHFTARRYKKYFYINDSDEIVTLNGVNPTYEEGDAIARITAIEIDPQNTRIRTPEFTVESVERKSKKEQIDEVLDSFMRSYGVVDFLEDDANA